MPTTMCEPNGVSDEFDAALAFLKAALIPDGHRGNFFEWQFDFLEGHGLADGKCDPFE